MTTDTQPITTNPQKRARIRFGSRSLFYLTTLFALGVTVCEGWMGVNVVAFLVLTYLVFSATGSSLPRVRVAFFIILTLAVLFSAFLDVLRPAILAARASSNLGHAHQDAMKLASAILDYRSKHGRYPRPFTVDAEGNRLHSWRTLILPHLGEQTLYNRIRLDEPWDSPTNKAIFDGVELEWMRGGQAFTRLGRTTETHYLAVVDERTMWPTDTVVDSVLDGDEKTLLFMEVASSGVDWFEPQDLDLAEAVDLLTDPVGGGLGYEHHGLFQVESIEGRRVVAIADGSQASLGTLANRSDALAMLTRDGGENYPGVRGSYTTWPGRTRSIRWAKIVNGVVLLVLFALPAFERPRRWLLGIEPAATEGA